MTPKMPSANLGRVGPSDEQGVADAAGEASEGVGKDIKATGESYEDSLEDILLQASAVPPPAKPSGAKPSGAKPSETKPTGSKLLGSKTLMGFGIEGLDLSALRATHAKVKSESQGMAESQSRAENEMNTPIVQMDDAEVHKADALSTAAVSMHRETGETGSSEAMDRSDDSFKGSAAAGAVPPQPQEQDQRSQAAGPAAGQHARPRGTTLIDDVAQALNVQASEYRDRARGRLPGMPSSKAQPIGAAALSNAASGRTEAAFEDPDDGPTALTPGVPPVDEHHAGAGDTDLSPIQGPENPVERDTVVVAPMWLTGAKPDSRPFTLPRIAGVPAGSGPAPSGPPAAVASRTVTPSGGPSPSASGSVRLPTPTPGHPLPTLPAPTGGRSSSPAGMPTSIAMTRADSDLTATAPSTPISLEASRRVMANNAMPVASGRAAARGQGSVTEPVIRSFSTMPFLLTAHIKIATLSLAGLIAVTFAGGLLVGMLVWKGQGRVDSATNSRMAPPAGSPAAPAHPQPPGQVIVAGSSASPPRATEAAPVAASSGPVAPATGPVVPAMGPVVPAMEGSGSRTERATTPGASDSETETEAARTAGVSNRKSGGSRVMGARGPSPVAPTADAPASASKSLAPRPARPAPAVGSKPMATNAASKPAVKSKAKAAWHDPFAD
jgi:hypothetical protein